MKNKGKVYPCPSSSSSSIFSSSTANRDAPSVLKLLPAAILALICLLSAEDREVLAYIIASSIRTANLSSIADEKKKSNKKSNTHKPPVFDCECFDCYTSYWFRWDSSPNRELIHEAIEAFEGHLASGEQSKRKSRRKRREKMGRRPAGKSTDVPEIAAPEEEADVPEVNAGYVVVSPGKVEELAGDAEAEEEEEEAGNDSSGDEIAPLEAAVVLRSSSADSHKGLARKVLPDVVGLLNSRLWSLWSPNIY